MFCLRCGAASVFGPTHMSIDRSGVYMVCTSCQNTFDISQWFGQPRPVGELRKAA